MDAIFQWLIDNLATIKDVFWIVFTSAATIVAILTYRRARHTVFQPLRQEVVKRQTDIFVTLLELLSPRCFTDFMREEYFDIILVNLFYQLEDLGITFGDENIKAEAEKKRNGYKIIKPGSVYVFDDINKDPSEYYDYEEIISRRIQNAKSGTIELEVIYLSQSYYDISFTLKEIEKNPFVPTIIQKKLGKLLDEIEINIQNSLADAILESLKTTIKKVIEDKKGPGIIPEAVFNKFNGNAKKINHEVTLKEIIGETRKYLMVDKMWE